ncbi:MAG: thioredoxin family protein [Verrucomicrobiota bacterium]
MKRLILSALVLAASTLFAADGWQTDYKAALELAAKTNKPVLLDFTGSDWCGWCIKLDKETFAQPEFQKFAEKNLVLVTVDFPNNKPQSADVKKQNEELQKKFGVDGFPTLVLLDSKGKEITRNVGYLAGGPKAFIGWVEASVKK